VYGKVVVERVEELNERPRHLHPGRAPAHHHEREGARLGLRAGPIIALELTENVVAEIDRVGDVLQRIAVLPHARNAEIVAHGPGGQNQVVVLERGTALEVDEPLIEVEVHDRPQPEAHRLVSPEDVADVVGDVVRLQPRHRDLVEQRLKLVVIVAVDQRDLRGGIAKRLGGLKPAEAGPDDDDVRVAGRP